jgi:hypothetical protein
MTGSGHELGGDMRDDEWYRIEIDGAAAGLTTAEVQFLVREAARKLVGNTGVSAKTEAEHQAWLAAQAPAPPPADPAPAPAGAPVAPAPVAPAPGPVAPAPGAPAPVVPAPQPAPAPPPAPAPAGGAVPMYVCHNKN